MLNRCKNVCITDASKEMKLISTKEESLKNSIASGIFFANHQFLVLY